MVLGRTWNSQNCMVCVPSLVVRGDALRMRWSFAMTRQTNNFMNLFHGLKMSNAIIIIFLTRNCTNLQIQWSSEIKKDGEKGMNDGGLDDLMVLFTDIVEFFLSFFFIYLFFCILFIYFLCLYVCYIYLIIWNFNSKQTGSFHDHN